MTITTQGTGIRISHLSQEKKGDTCQCPQSKKKLSEKLPPATKDTNSPLEVTPHFLNFSD